MPDQVIIMGAGPAGLACAYELTAHSALPLVIERSPWVGGLARTIERDGFRFDIGGHRWFTKNDEIHAFFVSVVADELVWVDRVSRIYYDGKFFFYPLRVANALAGMGIRRSVQAIVDHVAVRLRPLKVTGEATMEQAYTNQFGRTLYQQFFRSYSEKVWGMPCDQVSGDWVTQRSKGLSLTAAIKDAFAQSRGEYESLVDRFAYPALGIGRFSERMADAIIARGGAIELNARVTAVHHDGKRVTGVTVRRPTGDTRIDGSQFVSSIPITTLIHAMRPKAPDAVRQAADSLRFRELITVTLFLNQPQVTTDTWLYLHDPNLRFARIHEPRNWSAAMAPEGKTSIVCELFCDRGDHFWNASDDSLIALAIEDLESLRFIERRNVLGGDVLRAVRAYPTYTLGYQRHLDTLKAYVHSFENLQIVGRYGTFRYNNSDHSVETGVLAARNLLGGQFDIDQVNSSPEYLEEKRRIIIAPARS